MAEQKRRFGEDCWFYTSDRLPEPGELVQFAARGEAKHVHRVGWRYPANPTLEATWLVSDNLEYADDAVYAWRPLADAPEER